MSCAVWLRHTSLLTWLWTVLPLCTCRGLSIDQAIARAMTPPGDYGVVYDRARGTVLVDLDMVFTIQHWNAITAHLNKSDHQLYKRSIFKAGYGHRLWPGGVVRYEIDEYAFGRRHQRVLHAAMEEWMRHTCVRFVPAGPSTRHKIRFVSGRGCASSVGMTGDTQDVTLGYGCRTKGVVIHELGHVLGFNHEQTRPDRDQYVRVRWENIPRYLQYNFRKYAWSIIRDLGVPYDYLSIMHYGKSAFSTNGRVTMETRDRRYQDMIGNRRGLSFRDIKATNILYSCRPRDPACVLQDSDCPGEGFVSKDCTCWCPTIRRGRHVLDNPYYVCDPGSGSGEDSQTEDRSGGRSSGASTTDDRKCEDKNDNCAAWAARGECSASRTYMHANCRKACGLCENVTSSCRDVYEGCEYWRQKGYCQMSRSRFITSRCRMTCGLCPTSPGSRVVLPCERNCRNEHEQCEEWAERGECRATPDYMLRHCRKACKTCCSTDGRGDTRAATPVYTRIPSTTHQP